MHRRPFHKRRFVCMYVLYIQSNSTVYVLRTGTHSQTPTHIRITYSGFPILAVVPHIRVDPTHPLFGPRIQPFVDLRPTAALLTCFCGPVFQFCSVDRWDSTHSRMSASTPDTPRAPSHLPAFRFSPLHCPPFRAQAAPIRTPLSFFFLSSTETPASLSSLVYETVLRILFIITMFVPRKSRLRLRRV